MTTTTTTRTRTRARTRLVAPAIALLVLAAAVPGVRAAWNRTRTDSSRAMPKALAAGEYVTLGGPTRTLTASAAGTAP